ncbi:MAG: addiction module toxin RelE [Alphaproteobacteria bacterium PA4]|nr:MAG: addiction module toxin RelE [Alphaproteobacteria bacterium PA4]
MQARTFKTRWFAKAARKAQINDDELCAAIREVMQGLADDLGGGVYKKRLDRNRQRSIIVAKGRRFWVDAYLFAKQDRANIDDKELREFRELARLYEQKADSDISRELALGKPLEICHGD